MSIIGIDLGTTNSAAAIWRDGKPELVRNALGEVLTPSVVGLDDNGEIIVGAEAKDRLITHPDLSLSRFKQWMGTDRTAQVGSHDFSPTDLSALVLKSLYSDVMAAGEDKPDNIIISVPAYFSDPQRKATLAAARLAGVPADTLVNEPTAAALAYGLDSQAEGQFIVLDLGGGTFDVTILDKYEGVMEVRASAGDSFLGGENFTDALVDHFIRRHSLTIDRSDLVSRSRLRRFAELVKCGLSGARERDYDLELDQGRLHGILSREEFEEQVAPLTARLRLPIERTLRDSNVDPSEIDQVILVGGATRMPLVRRLASRLFGRIPMTMLDPDHIIALGAAARAALAAREESFKDVVMTDVCPHTLGTAVVEAWGREETQVISPIIERNAVVPISRVERYWTAGNNQTKVNVDIYQGEQLRPGDNVKIGELDVAVPLGKRGDESIDVRFTYDTNATLEVEVTVVSTGEKSVKYFQENASQLNEADLKQRFETLSQIRLAPRDQLPNKALIAHAERLYVESSGALRDSIRDSIRQFVMTVDDQTNRNPDEARKSFKAYLASVEQHLFPGMTLAPDDIAEDPADD
jgi:molecular chaperone HscC